MQPLKKTYEMSVCEVKTMSNELLIAGYISKVTDEYLQISSNKGDILPLIPYNNSLKISIYNTKQGFKILAGTCYLSTDTMLRVVNVDNLQDFERRSFFRVNTQLGATIYYVKNDDVTGNQETHEIKVNVENLSLSGLLFTPIDEKYVFNMKDVIVADLMLPSGRASTVKTTFSCRICRIEQMPGKEKKYGCEFFNFSEKQSDNLCAFIFEAQREMLKKRKSNTY